jgi:hypothetical protein
MYNGILLYGKFPDRWCKAILAPIHENGRVSDQNNYRGIALLSVVGKFVTKIINKRSVDWAEENELQREEQAGFRNVQWTTCLYYNL